MSWWAGAGAGALVLATVWLPGALVLRVAGRRGLEVLALAPLVSFGMAGAGAVAAHTTGLPWDHVTALAVLALVAAVAHLLRRPVVAEPLPALHPRRTLLAGAVLTGTLLQVVPVLVGMGRPGRLLDAYDAVVHLATVRHVQDSGVGSSFALAGAGEPGVPRTYYPAGWHDLVALVPTWPDALTVFAAVVVLVPALAWTAGLAHLTRVVLPHRPRTAAWAALLSAAGLALPLTLVGQEAGLVPNATALALLPGAVAVVARRGKLDARWAVAAAGALLALASVHPNTALAAVVVLLPWVVSRVATLLSRLDRRARAWTLGGLGGVVVAAALATAVAAGTDLAQGVASFPGDLPYPWTTTAVALLSGKLGTAAGGAGALVVLAAAAGAVLVRRLPGVRWFAGASLLVLVLFVCGRSGVPVLGDVDAPWYGESKRIAPALAMTFVPLAALTVDVLGAWLAATGRLRTALRPRRAALLVGGLVVVPGLASGVVDTGTAAWSDWGGPARQDAAVPTYASDAELAMLHRLTAELGDGAVLGSPHSGAAHLSALSGQAVTVRSPVSQVPDRVRDVAARLPDLGRDPGLCADLDALGIRYLYVDPVTFRHERAELPSLTEPPAEGVRLVDRGGTAALYEVTACS